MELRRLRAPLLAAMVAALATAAILAGAPGKRPAAAFHGQDVTKEAWNGAFRLTDSANRARTLQDFRGKVLLLTFGYTHCPDVCPTTLAKFAQVRQLLGADGARVQVLFITIDPERDSAELLRNYVPAFDPDFLGLRGTEEQTDAVTRAYHANYQIVEYRGSTLVDHTASTYLLDAQGRIRVVSPYEATARDLADDVRVLLQEDPVAPLSKS